MFSELPITLVLFGFEFYMFLVQLIFDYIQDRKNHI